MKITTGLIKQFVDLNIQDDEIVRLIKEHIGEVDHAHNLSKDYENIVIAEITKKEDHPDADKLGVYQIDYGENENIQVVAGDKLLNVGDKVAYIKVGSTVPYSIYTEEKPFIVKSVKLRGVMSHGMLGSQKELNVGSDHERVMVLPNEATVGMSFSEYYDLNDTVIDIENKALTNRGDLFSILGIARELSAITGNKFRSPEWYLNPNTDIKHEENCLKVNIVNDAEVLCPRYTAIALDNVDIEESPVWLKSSLMKCGIKPINNIVDITNYISLLIGQPLHAFDYDKLVTNDPNYQDEAYINIRMAKHDEKILALDDKLYELDEDIMVIADSTHPIAIAGIIGGKDTEVDENTKRVILESANFDKSSIRRSSMKLGLFTEAATRFKHNLDTHQCIAGLVKAVEMIKDITNSQVASNIIDILIQGEEKRTIKLSVEKLNTVLGTNLDSNTIKITLENLEYEVLEDESLYLTLPSWRRDIEIEEDVYEDIGRIYGFNNIPITLPKKDIKPPKKNSVISIKKEVRNILSNSGANETLTYGFTDLSSFERCKLDSNLAYRIRNPLSPELSLMRTSILQTLLQKGKENRDRGINRFALYEFNIAHINSYIQKDKLPIEHWYLSMLTTDSDNKQNTGSPYYVIKEYIEKITRSLDILNIQYDLVAKSPEIDLPPFIKNLLSMFEPNSSAILSIGGNIIGIMGEISNEVKDNFKLPKYTAGLEINLEELVKVVGDIRKYKEQPIYPSFTQDLCFEMSIENRYSDIHSEIEKIINSNDLWGRVECISIYQKDEESDKKRITFRITASNHTRTLSDKDIKQIVEKITKKIKEKYNAELV
jgi:phenylalanyl-tRNA synthetase beta chain